MRDGHERVSRIEALPDHHPVPFVGMHDLWPGQIDGPEDHKADAFVAPMVAELPQPINVTVHFNM